MKNSFMETHELQKLGFKSFGENVKISRNANFYTTGEISIGDNVRIDDFCILSGNIIIGSYVHIASHSVLTGGVAGIKIEDFANISQRVNVFAISDDYSGETMSNPMIPEQYKNLTHESVLVGKHVIIGCGAVVLPGVKIGKGAAIGALSLVATNVEEWTICAGIPAKRIKERSKLLLQLEKVFKEEMS